MVQFNWQEIKLDSNNTLEGIIVLTYALSIGYNSIISASLSNLQTRLSIGFVPQNIFKKRMFINTPQGIFNRYSTIEPQSYFKNNSWLFDKESTYNKVVYLFALSQRSINNKNLFIPTTYLDSKYWDNPYLNRKENKLWFNPELIYLKNQLLKRRKN